MSVFPPTNVAARTTVKTGAFSSSGVFAWTTNVNLFDALFAAPAASNKVGGTDIAANGATTMRRWFVVGKTVADVTKARTELFQQPKAVLQGTVTVGGVAAAGAHVTLIDDRIVNSNMCDDADPTLESCSNVFSSTLTDEYGFYRFVVPAGRLPRDRRARPAPRTRAARPPPPRPRWSSPRRRPSCRTSRCRRRER